MASPLFNIFLVVFFFLRASLFAVTFSIKFYEDEGGEKQGDEESHRPSNKGNRKFCAQPW